jgi:ATP-binding cassette, subfamily B, bacterial PglK
VGLASSTVSLTMRQTLTRILRLLGEGHRSRWVVVIVFALVASGLEMLGALVIFGLIARITTDTSGFELPLVGDVRTLVPGLSDLGVLALLGLLVGVFFVLRGAAIVGQAYVQYRVAENAGARLATRLLQGYLAMPASFHLQRNSAELIRNAFDTVQQFTREGLVSVVKLLSHGIMILGLLTVLLVTTWQATLIAIVLLGPTSWLLLRLVLPRVKRMGKVSQTRSETTLRALNEGLGGWRELKLLGRQPAFVRAFEIDRRELARVRYLRSTAKEIPRAVSETVLVLFVLAFLGIAIVIGDGALQALPTLGLFGYVALRLQPSLNEVMHAANALKFAAAGIDHLYEDLALVEASTVPPTHAAQPIPMRRALELRGVWVRYPDADVDALRDIDLTIRAGEFIGIVGATGGGKSTLVDTIAGLLEPREGTILLDGVPLDQVRDGWQASIGVVHQTVFLTDASLRRNVALGIPEDEIDDAAVAEAVELAQLGAFIASLPDGVETHIGEGGVRVSGGQRQRLAIARALYHRPSTIVFDEGTSALDQVTESALIDALEGLRGERTLITVAHRLTTVRGCDRVVLIEGGRIVDAAPLEELAARHTSLSATDGVDRDVPRRTPTRSPLA